MPRKPQLSEEDEALRTAFGLRVADARAQLGIKPADFASIGGISMAHQYRIEAGERTAEVLYVLRLAQHFGAPIIDILFARNEKQQKTALNVVGKGNVVAGRDQVVHVGAQKNKA